MSTESAPEQGANSIWISQCTQKGVKPLNEDCVGVRLPTPPLLFQKGLAAVVAGGLSCAEAAQEASQVTVLNFLNDYYSTPDAWQVTTAVQKVLNALNRWLISLSYARSANEKKGHLSTLSTIVLKGSTAHIFHVGDSRIYLLREGELKQITRDHVVYLKDKQTLLTRAMGMDFNLDVDYHTLEVKPADIFLLVTDGVYPFVQLESFFEKENLTLKKWDAIAQTIVEQAIQNGSHDNASCIALFIESLPALTDEEHLRFLMKLPFPPPLTEGMVIDQLKVLKVISSTKRSEVYLVQDVESHQKMIMKAPSLNFVDDPHYAEQFIMQEWAGKIINHPAVIKVLEKKRAPCFLYYLMAWVEGETLDCWMKKNHRDVQGCIQLFEKIVKGVRALHRKEIIHQDLNPRNIMVNDKGQPIIIDLGSTYLFHSNAGQKKYTIPLGGLDYSSPELYLRGDLLPQSDQFSLAVILYEMFSLKKPFGHDYVKCQDLTHFLRLKYRPVYQHNPMVPIWIDYALQKALSIDPLKRYASLSEFVFDLTTPNMSLLPKKARPLIDQDPVLFWKSTSYLLFIINLLLLMFLYPK